MSISKFAFMLLLMVGCVGEELPPDVGDVCHAFSEAYAQCDGPELAGTTTADMTATYPSGSTPDGHFDHEVCAVEYEACTDGDLQILADAAACWLDSCDDSCLDLGGLSQDCRLAPLVTTR